MAENKVSRMAYIKKNFLWASLQNIIAIIFPLIIRTLFVYKIGDEYLGLNSLCNSIVTSLAVANLGIESVLIGNMYQPVANGDIDEICRQLKLCRSIYRIIGLIILIGAVVILPFLNSFISGNVPNVNIYVIFLVYVFNAVIGYWLFGYYRIIFLANQEVYYLSRLMIISYLFMYGLQTLALIAHNYYAYVFLMPTGTISYAIGIYVRLRIKHPEYKCKGVIETNAIKKLCKSVVACAVYKIRNSSRDSLDGVIISAILGLVILSKYQNYTTILSVPILLRQIFVNAITPSLGNYNVATDKQEQFGVVKVLWLFTLGLSGVGATCYFQIIQTFMEIWLGKDHVLSSSVVAVLGIYLFVLGICDFFQMMRQTNLLWEKGKAVACFEIVANLSLNILLVKWLGLVGVILATVVTILFICIPYELYLIVKDYFKQSCKVFLCTLFKSVAWMILSNGIIWLILSNIKSANYCAIVIQAVVSITVLCILFVLIFRKDDEYKSLIGIIRAACKD